MSILSWNCRGAKNPSSPIFPFITNLAAKCNVDFVFISETKCSVANLEPYFAKIGFCNSVGSDALGNSGGLFLGWTNRVDARIIFVDPNVILCNVISSSMVNYYIVFVYGCPSVQGRASVWDNISTLMNNNKGSTIIVGDLNQVENLTQKLGGNALIQGASNFVSWKLNWDLSELPFHGVNYTWTNNRDGDQVILEHLDRVYANSEWRLKFPEAITWNLPIFLSDHSPIIVDILPSKVKKTGMYKLEAWCLSQPEIASIIVNTWASTPNGSHLFKIQRKL